MASNHRPLSRYIRAVSSQSRELSPDINFGVDASDARLLPTFNESRELPRAGTFGDEATRLLWASEGEWQRGLIEAQIPGEAPVSALGLHGPRFAVVEADSFGTPIQVEPRIAEIVSRLEDNWPPQQFDPETMDLLSEQPRALTAALVNRISEDEGDVSDPSMYHILPWYLIDGLIQSLATVKPAASGLGIIINTARRLSPYFESAVPGLVATLERLASATPSDEETRSTAIPVLLTALRDGDVRRIPTSTRQYLLVLLAAISGSDPTYEETVRLISPRIAT